MRSTGASILVIDDDADIREVISEVLLLEGYRVRTAGDGRAALDLLADWRADLILLDLNMPRMDGWSFCAVLCQQPEIANIPVALMSASRSLQARALPGAPAAILEKPFGLEDLLHAVAEVLDANPASLAIGERAS